MAIIVGHSYAQSPSIDVTVSTTNCINGVLNISNSSTGTDEYLWDFCHGDLLTAPVVPDPVTLESGILAIDIVKDQNEWYAFATSSNNKILRLDYGNSLNNVPTVNDLGNPNSLLNVSYTTRVIKENGNWYGLVTNNSASQLIRLSFGSEITATPTAEIVTLDTNPMNNPRGLDIAVDNGTVYAIVGNFSTTNVTIIDFGNSITNDGTATSIAMSDVHLGVSFAKQDNNWYGLVMTNTLERISFGSSISATPLAVDEVTLDEAITNGTNISIQQDGGDFYGITASRSGTIYRINFGSNLSTSSASVVNLGKPGNFTDVIAFDGTKQNSTYHFQGISIGSNQLYQLQFNTDCGYDFEYSTDIEPKSISYNGTGDYTIILDAFSNSSTLTDRKVQALSVSSLFAPNIDFSTINRCINNSNDFVSIDDLDISSHSWDFNNDGIEDSDLANPTYDFGPQGVGTYPVALEVIGNNGCFNKTYQEIPIYSAPGMTPDFDYTALNLCTTSEISFSNLTSETGFEGVLQYHWDFNGEATSNEKNPTYSFSTAGTKAVDLIALVPGCSTSVYSENLEIIEGSIVDFTYSNNCFGEAIEFTDETSGTNITGYAWDFGDAAGSSPNQNPTYTFATEGDYEVVLTVTNLAGCENSSTQTITVSDDAKASFSNTVATENLPVSFTALDLTLDDDEINSWTWNFDGLGSSSEQNPDFTFDTAGDYQVDLNVQSNQGCVETIMQTVSVQEAVLPIIDVIVPGSACINETLYIQNNSVNASEYLWDFCHGDLLESFSETLVETLASNILGIEMIKDGANWHAFATSSDNIIYRLDYGSSLKNTPTIVTLGNPGSLLNIAYTTRVIKENGNWYGLTTNNGSSQLIRLSFGSNITNVPTAEIVTLDTNPMNNPRGLDIAVDNGSVYAIIGNFSTSNVTLIDFGSSITNDGTTTTITMGSTHLGVSFTKKEDNWYAFAMTNTLERITFGTSISSSPVSVDAVTLDVPISNGSNINIQQDGEGFYGIVASRSGNIYRIDLGSDLNTASATVVDLGKPGNFSDVIAFDGVKQNSSYFFQGISVGSDQLYQLEFNKDCNLAFDYSSDIAPRNIKYDAPGNYTVIFDAYNDNSTSTERNVSTVSVSSLSAPSINFSTINQCLSITNDFVSINNGDINSYSWDFDNDGIEDSNLANPTYDLGSEGIGTYPVSLKVIGNNGCSNTAFKEINIYPAPPIPTFTYSSPNDPLRCTESAFTFTNSTDESNHVGATLTYSWDYNGEGSTTDRHGSYTFNTDGTKTIILTAAIPGCETSSSGTNIDLIAGPAVDFSIGDKCLGDITEFTNLTSGANITSQTWTFGDGNGATTLSPSHEYETAGNYNVSLTVDNLAGCSNALEVPLTVDDRPNANFNMGVGCEGQVVGFEDQSTVSSANIESYTWDFGGLGSSSQEDPLFVFETQGIYQVNLTVESTFGCTDEVTKNLNVQLAPVAAFDIELGCLDETTRFVDQSDTEAENGINIWYWDINGDIVPNTQNPTEIFDTPGDYTATLTVTPGNLCTSTISKDFTIHELPVASFSSTQTCDNQFTTFIDESTATTAAIVAYNWQFDEEGSGNSNPAVFNFESSGDYEISLTVIDEVGCESIDEQTVTINPSPTAAFEVDLDIGPAPLVVEFTNQSEGSTDQTWKFGDADQTTSNQTHTAFTYANLGNYTAELIATNDLGCSDTVSLPITVAEPILDLELVQLSQEETNGKTSLILTVRNSGNVIIKGFDIRIDLEDNSSIFESYQGTLLRNETITYPLNFTFSTLNNNTGYTCINVLDLEASYTDINIVNNERCIDFKQELIVENSYPNPANSGASTIRLNMILPTNSPVQMFLLDATGGVLHQEVYAETTVGLNSFFMDIYAIKQGIYFIKVIYDGIESTQRFVKL